MEFLKILQTYVKNSTSLVFPLKKKVKEKKEEEQTEQKEVKTIQK